jgi:hypothetical protein
MIDPCWADIILALAMIPKSRIPITTGIAAKEV